MSGASSSSTKKPLEKQFEVRDSILTDRFQYNEDIKTIYNLFAIILISLLTNTVIHDYTQTGELHFGLRLILIGFNKFYLVILFWCVYNILGYLAFLCFNFWAQVRLSQPPNGVLIPLWDKIWLSALLLFYLSSLYSVQKVVWYFELAPCSACVIFLEELRILMKLHAFVRTNASKVLNHKPHSDKELLLPTFRKFVYFAFAPTLIYKDEYPRTQRIRWKFVFHNFAEVLGIIFLLSLVVERFLVPPLKNICVKKHSTNEVLIPIIANSFPGIMFMLCGFYSVLHSFQNGMAELLRFGDRMFYREWWISRSLSQYYRTWNVIVHDWLFFYVYKDMYEIVVPKNKLVAKLTVFVLSAVIHEWAITNILGLFLPVQFMQFCIASIVLALLNILDLPVGNLMVWYLIVFGSGMQVNLYTMEFFARQNCPIPNSTTWDFFKPRFITCGCLE